MIALIFLALSAKFNEKDIFITDLQEFTFNNNKNYEKEDLIRYEVLCLKAIDYRLNHTTPFDLLENICFQGFIFSDECFIDNEGIVNIKRSNLFIKKNKENKLQKVYSLPFELLEKVNYSVRILEYSPIEIACACICITREMIGLTLIWHDKLENLTGLSYSSLRQCIEFIKCNSSIKSLQTQAITKALCMANFHSDKSSFVIQDDVLCNSLPKEIQNHKKINRTFSTAKENSIKKKEVKQSKS